MPVSIRDTNFGKLVDIVGGIQADGRPPQTRTLLLDANLSVADPCREFESGSWVMMVSSEVLEWPPQALGPQRICPLVAHVSLGQGGAAHELELDAFPGFAIQLPAVTARCELAWDPLPTQAPGMIPFWNWRIPLRMRVRGTVFRGTIRPYGHRSFVCNQDNVTPGLIRIETIGDVPRFARSAMVLGPDGGGGAPAQPYNLGSSFSLMQEQGMAIVTAFDGTQLHTLKAVGSRIPVTAQCLHWSCWATAGPAQPNFPVIVDFEVTL